MLTLRHGEDVAVLGSVHLDPDGAVAGLVVLNANCDLVLAVGDIERDEIAPVGFI